MLIGALGVAAWAARCGRVRRRWWSLAGLVLGTGALIGVIGGHSLGGTVASRFAGGGGDEVAGLLLWASYPALIIAGATTLDVLSVSASNDGLATPADIEASRADLPADTEFVVEDGATHAFFGDYGEQRGDGDPAVPRDDAQAATIAATLEQLGRIDAAVPG